jgi:hypothetical protein
MKYIGQTDSPFQMSIQEHFRDSKYNNCKFNFETQLLENQHSIGHIDDIMEIVYTTNKGRLMDNIEKIYLFRKPVETTKIMKNTVKPYTIFDVISTHNSPQSAHW